MTRRTRADEGNALMLVPAGVLVLLMLGAIAVDSAVVFLAQRDLSNRTSAVANDVAGFASSDDAFYRDGVVQLDGARAAAYTQLAFAPDRTPAGYESWGATAEVASERTVSVRAWAEVRYLFAKAVPGMPDTTRVHAESVATAAGG